METILVATDFSKPANNAVAYAAHLTRFLNSKLIIVHAFSLPLAGYDAAAPLATIDEMRGYAMEKLKLLKAQLTLGGFDTGIELYAELGTTVNVLKDMANTCGAELVVMGMTGEAGKIKRHFIGSNTLKAASDLSLPLLVISEQVNYKPVQTISLAARLDGLEKSTLLYSARDVAATFGAVLEIVTVEQTGKEQPRSAEIFSFIEKKLGDTKHKLVFLREADDALALEYYFKFHETDLVIVNPRKHSFFKDLFSESMTRHLAFHMKVPLLVLH
jgi:nucleotide-binding universal stress UspA family protein